MMMTLDIPTLQPIKIKQASFEAIVEPVQAHSGSGEPIQARDLPEDKSPENCDDLFMIQIKG
jgi:hypothetical protein